MHEQLKQIGNLKRKMRGLSLRGFIHHLMTDRTLERVARRCVLPVEASSTKNAGESIASEPEAGRFRGRCLMSEVGGGDLIMQFTETHLHLVNKLV